MHLKTTGLIRLVQFIAKGWLALQGRAYRVAEDCPRGERAPSLSGAQEGTSAADREGVAQRASKVALSDFSSDWTSRGPPLESLAIGHAEVGNGGAVQIPHQNLLYGKAVVALILIRVLGDSSVRLSIILPRQ